MEKRGWLDAVLGLGPDWRITRVERTPERKELRVELARAGGGRLRCPHCGEACPGYGTRRRECGIWTHGAIRPSCDVPRVRCREHGVVTMQVPWSEGSSRYTAEFEAEVIRWLKEASVQAVAQRMRLSWNAADGIMQRAVARGRGKQALKAFYEGLGKDRRAAVESVSMDMWGPYIAATLEMIPDALKKIAFDRFHVAKHLGDAVDKVRRAEHRALVKEGTKSSRGRSTSG